MRLGSSSINDPLIGVSNDYAELCDLETSSSTVSGLTATTAGTKPRWAASSINNRRNVSAIYNQSVGSSSMTHIRNSYEAEDISTYDRARTIGNSTGSLCGLGGGGNSSSSVPTGASRYYSPPGTSYTIIERSHSPHYYYNAAGDPLAAAASKSRGGYYLDTLKQNGQKKRPISPERMFPITSSSSTPSSYHHLLSNGRNSPPVTSSSHQVYHRAARDRSMITRTVTMSRDQQPDGSHGFGICVKGGRETGIGVYISRVEEGSVAERSGLKPGDTILEVNGTPFSGMTHDEALTRCVQILKSSRQITMTVRGPTSLHGFGPPASATDVFKSSPMTGALLSPPSRQTCSWIDRHGRPASPPYDFEGRRSDRHERVRRVELVIEPGQSLGLMIRGGIEYGLGIYVTGVDKDSVADRVGLSVGDQILEVNGQSFMNVTHDEAVNQFKFHKRMSLVVRDVGKVPHSCTTIEPEPWDVGRRKCPVSAMVEEKARSLLPRHQFSNLSFYINEYGARGLTVDAFVSILLEMLDTPEKHTLVTEIRELIFPEDRPRYDELVYRRSKLSSRMDYYDSHRASDTDIEVSEVTKKKHVTMTDEKTSSRSGTPKMNASGTDIKNRPPAPLPQGPSIHRHSSMRHLSSSQGHMSEMSHLKAEAKKRFTPPPTFAKSSINSASNFTYGNQFKQFSPLESKCGDKLYNPRPRRGSDSLSRLDYDSGSYLEGIRTQIGGITEKVKSWYWGRPLEFTTKFSRSFDLNEDGRQNLFGGENKKYFTRYQSMQRLPTEDSEANLDLRNHDNLSHIVPDENGNLFITVRKTKAILGIAMEGGANTKHPLPRIINIHEHGAAYEAGGLEVGQLILEVDNTKVEGMQHQDVARLIAECYANRDRNEITFLVVEAKKSNLEPKPTALVFLEQ